MPKFIAIDAGDGSTREVSEQEIREDLRGNWKDVDQAFAGFLANGSIRTPFQFFEVACTCTCYMFKEPHKRIDACDPSIQEVKS